MKIQHSPLNVSQVIKTVVNNVHDKKKLYYTYFIENEHTLIKPYQKIEDESFKNKRDTILSNLLSLDFKNIMDRVETDFLKDNNFNRNTVIAGKIQKQKTDNLSEHLWIFKWHIQNMLSLVHNISIDHAKNKIHYTVHLSSIGSNSLKNEGFKDMADKMSFAATEINFHNLQNLCLNIVKNYHQYTYRTAFQVFKKIAKKNPKRQIIQNALLYNNKDKDTVDVFSKEELMLHALEHDLTLKKKLPLFFAIEHNTCTLNVNFQNDSVYINTQLYTDSITLNSVYPAQKFEIKLIDNVFHLKGEQVNTQGFFQTFSKQFSLNEYDNLLSFIEEHYADYFKIKMNEKQRFTFYYEKNLHDPFLKELQNLGNDNSDFSLSLPDLKSISIHDLMHIRFPIIVKYKGDFVYKKKVSFKNKKKYLLEFKNEVEKKILSNVLDSEKETVKNKKRL